MTAPGPLKPTHKAVKAYREALDAYASADVEHEGATETAFQRLLAYTFNLKTNELRPKKVPNPGAGREHRFRAWRLKGSPIDVVVMRTLAGIGEKLESDAQDAETKATPD